MKQCQPRGQTDEPASAAPPLWGGFYATRCPSPHSPLTEGVCHRSGVATGVGGSPGPLLSSHSRRRLPGRTRAPSRAVASPHSPQITRECDTGGVPSPLLSRSRLSTPFTTAGSGCTQSAVLRIFRASFSGSLWTPFTTAGRLRLYLDLPIPVLHLSSQSVNPYGSRG